MGYFEQLVLINNKGKLIVLILNTLKIDSLYIRAEFWCTPSNYSEQSEAFHDCLVHW